MRPMSAFPPFVDEQENVNYSFVSGTQTFCDDMTQVLSPHLLRYRLRAPYPELSDSIGVAFFLMLCPHKPLRLKMVQLGWGCLLTYFLLLACEKSTPTRASSRADKRHEIVETFVAVEVVSTTPN